MSDNVNHPPHYTAGRFEAIDVIEDVIASATTPRNAYLHGQCLKYLLRLWHKGNKLEDAKKARWYLDRMIKAMEDK